MKDQKSIVQKIGAEKICSNIGILLDFLGVENYRIVGNKAIMSCPIHGGDNPGACVIFLDGETCCGNWMCFTHNCHINGCQLHDFINSFNKEIDPSIFDNVQTEKRISTTIKKKDNILCTLSDFKKLAKIPSSYYVKRGYSRYILNRYNVGFCNNPNSSMYMRTIIPVFDDQEEIIGVLGRSVFDQCPKCKCYHGEKRDCPEEEWKRWIYSKWKNSPDFNPSQHLYNFWNVKKYKPDTIILVEGPGDVWRLEEAGIKNSVAMFGCFLKPNQIKLLLENNIHNIIACFDMDDAGRTGLETLKKQNKFIITEVKLPKKDIGSMSIEEIKCLTL